MFTIEQTAHFRAFGFVVARGMLRPAETATLTTEVRTELIAAFGGLGTDTDPDGTGGIRGDYLPLAVDRAPLSQSLMADDPRFIQGAAQLLGSPVVPAVPTAICFTSNANWHADHGPDIGGVKFLAYLEERTADTGALRVLPGSHDPGFGARMRDFRAADPGAQGFPGWSVPDVVLPTEPGDVIAFDAHLWHASAGGDRRLAWSAVYLPWPGVTDKERIRLTRELLLDADFTDGGYDTERWPAWREWAAGAPAIPSRMLAVQRLRLLGVSTDVSPAVRA